MAALNDRTVGGSVPAYQHWHWVEMVKWMKLLPADTGGGDELVGDEDEPSL